MQAAVLTFAYLGKVPCLSGVESETNLRSWLTRRPVSMQPGLKLISSHSHTCCLLHVIKHKSNDDTASAVPDHSWCLQAAKELEAAEKAKKDAKKEAATKAAAEAEGKKEAEGSKLTKTSSSPKQGPKTGDAPKAEAGKGPDQVAPEGNDDDDESTPRDADGNELAVDIDTSKLTAAQLQEELTKRGLDVKWQPLKGKKVLVERLQVTLSPALPS